MKLIAFDHVEPTPDFQALPIELRLSTSRSSALLKLMLLAPMMVMLAVPLSLIGARAAGDPDPISHLVSNPLAALQIVTGLLVWTALFLWPLKRIIGRMGARRRVEIDAAQVRVTDTSPFGGKSWSAPLQSYAGIAHHIRASLSGNRHELILVHTDPAKSIVLAIADRITQATVDRATALLGLPEVPARSLYARGA